MTTYIQKKLRSFMERPEWLRPERRRSESRLKTYHSSTDIRNWCDVVEDRRQHILELVTKGFEKCSGKLVPLDVILDMLMAMANADIAKLKKCLKQLWSFIYGLDLSDEDMRKLKELTAQMDSVCKEQGARGDEECDPSCVAAKRHKEEQSEIEDLLRDVARPTSMPTIQTRMQGPGKMVTRIKGLQPGFEVINDPASPGHLTIKPSKSPSSKYIPDPVSKSTEQVPTSARLKATKSESSPDKLAATEALCSEQRDKIAALTKERDELKKKLEACLKELDNFKKLQTVANPSLPASCQQEIEALEAEIKIMRSGNPSPEEEAEIIKKEVEILKRYCTKLKDVENENEKLKVELMNSKTNVETGDQPEMAKMETLKDKLKHLEELTDERDALANKVLQLEKQLLQYQNLPADVEQLKTRSGMLDTVMEERDNLGQKLKAMKAMEEELQRFKAKAERVDELEREMKNLSKGDRSSGIELKKTQSRASNLEIELQNVRCERNAMKKRIETMKKELDSQKAKVTEAEMLKMERDRLQIKLNELAEVQSQYEETMNKMKIFDTIKAERDMYKQKYEDVLEMECKCEMMKSQIEEARTISRERDHLEKQVQDLEACICEQEDEIKSLVLQVDSLSKTQNESSIQVNSYKDELAKKDRLLAASQEQLTHSQGMVSRIRELEKLLHHAEHKLLQKDCHIKCLENELNKRTGTINVNKKLNRQELDSVDAMRKELETAKAENRRLQEIANKMLAISGDDHMKKMLKQSECAVKRVVQELGKQYKEWEHMKVQSPKSKLGSTKHDCLCAKAGGEVSSGDDCDKLREELEELQKEKRKLEQTVRQLQGRNGPSETKCPQLCANLDS